MRRAALFAAFVGTVYGANWLIATFGPIPVGFGLQAPAGVLMAGLAFGLRDALHEVAGRWCVIAAIVTGAALALLLEDAATVPGGLIPLAFASAAAFLVAELIDLAVYGPLRDRQWGTAVVASNLAGAAVDSALFLWLAFGSFNYFPGQLVGKAWMIAPALLLVGVVRERRAVA